MAILLVLEGLLPFLNPGAHAPRIPQLSQMQDRELRVAGFVSMVAGLVLLFVVRS